MSKQNIVKKISLKTAVSVMDFKKLEVVTAVLRIVGVVRKAKIGEHAQYGDFYEFSGEFHATDLRTGEVSVSGKAFLPAPVDAMLYETISAKGDGGGDVEFAFDISVKPRPDLPIGYEYIVSTLTEAKPSNPLEKLLNSLPQISLPAPAQAAIQDTDGAIQEAHQADKKKQKGN